MIFGPTIISKTTIQFIKLNHKKNPHTTIQFIQLNHQKKDATGIHIYYCSYYLLISNYDACFLFISLLLLLISKFLDLGGWTIIIILFHIALSSEKCITHHKFLQSSYLKLALCSQREGAICTVSSSSITYKWLYTQGIYHGYFHSIVLRHRSSRVTSDGIITIKLLNGNVTIICITYLYFTCTAINSWLWLGNCAPFLVEDYASFDLYGHSTLLIVILLL
ncbi:hypothetical protein RDABS01_008437, partial [Bienertia sinuspersici]